jgi:nicotinamidase-related amidase
MIRLDPARTATVAIDMHRGHLDPAVATLPLAAERCGPVINATDLEFVLRRRLGADTVILAGINTTTCVLAAAFEATNRDFRVVVAADAVDSMDGEEMHGFALELVGAALGWPLGNDDIVSALG